MPASEKTLHDVTVLRIHFAILWSDALRMKHFQSNASHQSNGLHVITQRRPSRHSLFDIVLHLNPMSRALTHAKIACPCKRGFREIANLALWFVPEGAQSAWTSQETRRNSTSYARDEARTSEHLLVRQTP